MSGPAYSPKIYLIFFVDLTRPGQEEEGDGCAL